MLLQYICILFFSSLQVYWFGPLLGGVAGALIYDFIFASNASLTRVQSCMLANEIRRSKAARKQEAPMAAEEQSLRHHTTPSPDDNEDMEVIDLHTDSPTDGTTKPKKDSNV